MVDKLKLLWNLIMIQRIECTNTGRGVFRWLLRVGWPSLIGLHGLGFVKFTDQHPPRRLASQGPFSILHMVKNTWEMEQPTPERPQIHCLLKSQQLPNEMATPINYAKHSCENGHQSHHLPLLDLTLILKHQIAFTNECVAKLNMPIGKPVSQNWHCRELWAHLWR